MKKSCLFKTSVACLLAVSALCGCGRVIDSGESYTPISQGTINTESYVFNSAVTSAAPVEDLGEFLVQPNSSINAQTLYLYDAAGTVTPIVDFPAGEKYVAGPLSPDSTKLFLYRRDPEATSDTDHYYGVIVDLATRTYTTSELPMFQTGTVNWGANNMLFIANRSITFFSPYNFSVVHSQFDVMNLIENDPDGKYVLTGMAYDRTHNRYIATVGERRVGESGLNADFRVKLGIAVITATGRTEKFFFPSDTMYCPADLAQGTALQQIIQCDSGSDNIAVFGTYFNEGSDTPYTRAAVINIATEKEILLPEVQRDVVLRGGWIYGVSFTPNSQWWETMNLNVYRPDNSGNYELMANMYSEGPTNRYVSMTGTRHKDSYSMFLYPNGDVLLKIYYNESGQTRVLLRRIEATTNIPTTLGSLPGTSYYRYTVTGIDAVGNVVFLSDYAG